MSFRVTNEIITLKKVEMRPINNEIYFVIHYEDDDEQSHSLKTNIHKENFQDIMNDLKKIQTDILIGEPFEEKCILLKFYLGSNDAEDSDDEDEVPQFRLLAEDSFY